MPAGKYRDRIRFERQVPQDDGHGNTVSGAWQSAVGPVWARVYFAGGNEAVTAGAPESLVPCEITIRDSSQARTVTAAMRAVDERSGRTFRLAAVHPRQGGEIVIKAQLEP